jgi:YVTN family beta-propeller protein
MTNKFLQWISMLSLSMLIILLGCSEDWPTDPPDVNRPELVSSSPQDGSLMNPNNLDISLEFNKEMDLASINSVVKVSDAQGNTITGSWSLNGATATFKASTAYTDLSRIDVLVPGAFDETDNWISPGVRDVNGNSMQYSSQFSFSTQGNYGNSQIYLGTGEPGNPSNLQVGIGIIKDLEFTQVGDLGTDGAKSIALNPAGTELFVASSGNNSVEILNTLTNTFEVSIPMPDGYGNPWFVEFTPDGLEAWILCKENNNAVVINTQTRSVSDTIPLADYCSGGGTLFEMAINHAGTKGYISTRSSLSLIVIDIQSKSVITSIENIVSSQSSTVVITSDDSKILVGDNWSTPHFQIIDATSNTVTGDITLGESAGSGLLTTVLGDYLYIAGRYEGFIYKMDLNDFSIVAETNTGEEMMGIAVDPEGTVVYVTAPWVGEGSVLVLTESDLTLLGRIDTGIWRGIVTR